MIPTEGVALPDNPRTGASRTCRYDPDLNLLFDSIDSIALPCDVTAPLGQTILTTCPFPSPVPMVQAKKLLVEQSTSWSASYDERRGGPTPR
jgi:hypothetical protein